MDFPRDDRHRESGSTGLASAINPPTSILGQPPSQRTSIEKYSTHTPSLMLNI